MSTCRSPTRSTVPVAPRTSTVEPTSPRPERAVQGRPQRLGVAGEGLGGLELGGLLAREVRQVEPQVVEERHPVGAHVLPELRLPVGTGAEAAARDAHDAGAAGLRLDEELGGQWAEGVRVLAHQGGPVLLVDDAVRRVPVGDLPSEPISGPIVKWREPPSRSSISVGRNQALCRWRWRWRPRPAPGCRGPRR